MRAFLIRRNSISLAICGIAAVLMFYVVNYPAAVDASASARQLPIYCVQRDQKLVSISFDAAWGNEDTQELIDILDRFQVKATFFVVGDWVDKYPESVKALHDAGHEVMNHSNTHAHYPQLSPQAVVDDLNACNDKIEAVTGVRPTLVRLPYGDYDDNAIRCALHRYGAHPVGCGQPGLERAPRPGDRPAGHRKGPARLHRSVPQRRQAHAGGPAIHPDRAHSGGLHLCAHFPDHSGRGIHH